MTITQLTAAELKVTDPARFNKEYRKWQEYCVDYDWWDYLEEDFKTQHAEAGVTVQSISFKLYGQGSSASFTGRIALAQLMKHLKLDEEYLPLYLAVEGDGTYATVGTSNYGNVQVSIDIEPWYQTPVGVFADLDPVGWEALIEAQLESAGLEDVALDFCEDICKDLYNNIEAGYEHLTSEEAFIESCECNEITFGIEGADE